MSKATYYSLVGSRETPKEVMELMTRFVEKCCHSGWVARSGGADGSDSCVEEGVSRFLSLQELPTSFSGSFMEIYLPWKDFNGRCSQSSGYYTLPFMDNKLEAEKIASETHPNWSSCSQGAKKLHTRNVFQCLGKDLQTPSRFILCWAKPKYKDRRTEECLGGTGTCVKLGIDNGAEIINLYWDDQLERIKSWVNK